MAFATVQDLENRWRDLSPNEVIRAAALLDDAAVLLSDYASAGAEKLKVVSVNMVKRAMMASGDAFAVGGQYEQTIGLESMLPAGELRVMPSEIRLLNDGVTVGFVRASR